MPPRRSAPRQSNVSNARFALMEDAASDGASPAPVSAPVIAPAPAPAPARPLAPAPPRALEPVPEYAKSVVRVSMLSPPQRMSEKDRERELEKEREREQKENITIEDLALPKSIITRLAKGVLPPNTQIQANAILAISNSTTVFINYLASHANENTVSFGRKTITPSDVFKALDDTEFSFLRGALEAEFSKYNAIQTEKRTSYRQKVRAKKSDDPDTSMADISHADTSITSEASGPRAKKARVEPSAAAEEEDAETEEEEEVAEEDDDDHEDVEEGEEDEEAPPSGDETQDALEVREGVRDEDEALDGDESD